MSKNWPLEIVPFTKEEQEKCTKIYIMEEANSSVGPTRYVLKATYEQHAGNIYNMVLDSDNTVVASFPRSVEEANSSVGPTRYVLKATYEQHAGNIYNMVLDSDNTVVASFPRSDTMSAKFPLEIKTFTKEEQMEHEKVYKTSEFFDDFSRVGPKKYTVMRYEKDAANIYNMKLCSSNIIVNSFPRSGTTWTQELVWLIANDFDFATAKDVPLHVRFPHLEFAPEILNELSNSPKLSSQFVMTHIPLSLLPPTLLDTCKVVYVARDPRDVALSNYHLERELCRLQENVKFEEYFEVFIANLRVYCPYFEHVKEAWAQRYHPNMLFIFYEHLSRDLKSVACRICDFFGKKYNEQQLDQLCDHLRFVNFKKNPAVTRPDLPDINFIRRGKPGGWRDHYNEKMEARAQKWIDQHLQDTDLRFPLN